MDWMDWTTLGVAVGGFLLGGASFVWNVLTWQRSGHRVEVDWQPGFTYGPTMGQTELLGVRARNKGRGPVTVVAWGFQAPDGRVMMDPYPIPGSPQPPHRLEGASEVEFMIVKDKVRRSLPVGGGPVELRPYVRLGDGQTVDGKRTVSVEPLAEDDAEA